MSRLSTCSVARIRVKNGFRLAIRAGRKEGCPAPGFERALQAKYALKRALYGALNGANCAHRGRTGAPL